MKKCVYDAGAYCAAKSSVGRMVQCRYPASCELFASAIDMDPPLERINLSPRMEYNDGKFSVSGYIAAQIVSKADKAVTDAVIGFARNAGITELYLLDESFVRSALLHEAERMEKLREKLLRMTSDMNSHEEEEK